MPKNEKILDKNISLEHPSLLAKWLPSHLLIISDMEFDQGVYSKTGTNLASWKNFYEESGYKLPKIIFWNVAGSTSGIPVTKFDNDVAMISGFSTNILENLLTLENYNPNSIMLEKLDVYLKMIKIKNTKVMQWLLLGIFLLTSFC